MKRLLCIMSALALLLGGCAGQAAGAAPEAQEPVVWEGVAYACADHAAWSRKKTGTDEPVQITGTVQEVLAQELEVAAQAFPELYTLETRYRLVIAEAGGGRWAVPIDTEPDSCLSPLALQELVGRAVTVVGAFEGPDPQSGLPAVRFSALRGADGVWTVGDDLLLTWQDVPQTMRAQIDPLWDGMLQGLSGGEAPARTLRTVIRSGVRGSDALYYNIYFDAGGERTVHFSLREADGTLLEIGFRERYRDTDPGEQPFGALPPGAMLAWLDGGLSPGEGAQLVLDLARQSAQADGRTAAYAGEACEVTCTARPGAAVTIMIRLL